MQIANNKNLGAVQKRYNSENKALELRQHICFILTLAGTCSQPQKKPSKLQANGLDQALELNGWSTCYPCRLYKQWTVLLCLVELIWKLQQYSKSSRKPISSDVHSKI